MDPAVRHGDVSGMFDACVMVTLETGVVLEQNIYPRDTHCHQVFIREWSRLLALQHNMVILIYINKARCPPPFWSYDNFQLLLLNGTNR